MKTLFYLPIVLALFAGCGDGTKTPEEDPKAQESLTAGREAVSTAQQVLQATADPGSPESLPQVAAPPPPRIFCANSCAYCPPS